MSVFLIVAGSDLTIPLIDNGLADTQTESRCIFLDVCILIRQEGEDVILEFGRQSIARILHLHV